MASSESITKKCEPVEGIVHGKRLIIVDTPGLYDTGSTDEETRTEIAKVVGLTTPGVHAFIVAIRIGRFTEEEISSVIKLSEIFGEEIYKRTVVLFTGKDDLEADKRTLDDYIATPDQSALRAFLGKCGKRVVAFDNRNRSDTHQTENLLGMVDDVVKANGNSYYTNEMFKQATRVMEAEQHRRCANTSRSEAEIRQEIRREIARGEAFGQKLIGILLLLIPAATLLAKHRACSLL